MPSLTKQDRRAAARQAKEEARKPHPTDVATAAFLTKRWGGFVRHNVLSRPLGVATSLVFSHDSPLYSEDTGIRRDLDRISILEAAFKSLVHQDTPASEIPKIARLTLEGITYEAPELDVTEDHVDEIEEDSPEVDGDLGGTGDGLDDLTLDQLRKLNGRLGNPVPGARKAKKVELLAALRAGGFRADSA